MPLLVHTITAQAQGVLASANATFLAPLFATAEMRPVIDLRALTNLHLGKLSVNIGLAGDYAVALKQLDDALKTADATHTNLMPNAALLYTPVIMDVVQDALALYSVPMGAAVGGGTVPTVVDLAKAIKDANAASAVEHMKECEPSYETECHKQERGVWRARECASSACRAFTPRRSHLGVHTSVVHTSVFTPRSSHLGRFTLSTACG